MNDLVPVVEIFESIQGEGIYTGYPCLFVRVAGCPVGCEFCDTKYAWKTDGEKVDEISVDTLMVEMLSGPGHVVFTGGEPMLYQEAIVELLDSGSFPDYKFIIETSGVVPCKHTSLVEDSRVSWSISPKNIEKFYPNYRWIAQRIHRFHEVCFKFLWQGNSDDTYSWINSFFIRLGLGGFPSSGCWEKIWVMPKGVTREEVIECSEPVWNFCVENGFKFSPREQVIVFDTRRGV